MEPIRCGLLTSQQLSEPRVAQNFKLLSTVLVYLLRRVLYRHPSNAAEQQSLPEAEEVIHLLYGDVEMESVYSDLSDSFKYCESLLMSWCKQFVEKLRSL